MIRSFIESLAGPAESNERRIYGVTLAEVIDNLDSQRLGRVQLRLPWMPEYEPWARVAVLQAGSGSGTFFIPQVGDEVLVAFNHGDVREPFVIGCLWNGQDTPPGESAADAANKRILRTPAGHEIVFDDLQNSITVTHSAGHSLTLENTQVKATTSGDAASITLESSGAVTLQGSTSIDLKAPTITLDGATVEVRGSASATLNGGPSCTIQGAIVRIN